MRARFVLALTVLVLAAATLPFGGCGDNDNGVEACCPVCGDGVCRGDEGACNCPQDCADDTVCTPIAPTCGDGVCEASRSPGESHERCPEDCALDCRRCD